MEEELFRKLLKGKKRGTSPRRPRRRGGRWYKQADGPLSFQPPDRPHLVAR